MIAYVCRLQEKFQISALTLESKVKVTYTRDFLYQLNRESLHILNMSIARNANSSFIFDGGINIIVKWSLMMCTIKRIQRLR